jgi:hypothetical protein
MRSERGQRLRMSSAPQRQNLESKYNGSLSGDVSDKIPEASGGQFSNIGVRDSAIKILDVDHCVFSNGFYPRDHIDTGSNLGALHFEVVDRPAG